MASINTKWFTVTVIPSKADPVVSVFAADKHINNIEWHAFTDENDKLVFSINIAKNQTVLIQAKNEK